MGALDHNIDPGNSGGSVPSPDTRTEYVAKPIEYPCPICDEVFDSDAKRRRHKAQEHPIKRPYFYLKGQAITNRQHIVRASLLISDIEMEDVEKIDIDSKTFQDITIAMKYIIENQSGIKRLRLAHQKYTCSLDLIFDIADEESLNLIDNAFFESFASSLPLGTQLELFNEKVHQANCGNNSYAGALGCYVTAIMAKDKLDESAIPFSEHLNKLGESLDNLRGIERPLSAAIGSIAGFMINDFTFNKEDRNLPKLKVAKYFFRNGRFHLVESYPQNSASVPIDNVSEEIINFCSASASYRAACIAEITKLADSPTTSEQDKIKLAFLLYIIMCEGAESAEKNMYRKRIMHSSLFENVLSKMESSSDEH